jgi:hypothetical protein
MVNAKGRFLKESISATPANTHMIKEAKQRVN